jgi:hypothetical protein
MDTRIDPARVAVHPSTLFDACLVALESGEFTQCAGQFERGHRRCAWGVIRTIAERAHADYLADVHPRMIEIDHRAGRLLGYAGIADANDAGVPFGEIAGALREARAAIEGPGAE